jgi:hypothetical protein
MCLQVRSSAMRSVGGPNDSTSATSRAMFSRTGKGSAQKTLCCSATCGRGGVVAMAGGQRRGVSGRATCSGCRLLIESGGIGARAEPVLGGDAIERVLPYMEICYLFPGTDHFFALFQRRRAKQLSGPLLPFAFSPRPSRSHIPAFVTRLSRDAATTTAAGGGLTLLISRHLSFLLSNVHSLLLSS